MSESAIVKTDDTDLNNQIVKAAESLQQLALDLDEETADKLLELAQATAPTIKGVEGDAASAKVTQVFLRQPSSASPNIPNDCKIGNFYSSDGRTLGGSFTFIPILTHAIRRKWGDDTIDCSSLDGKVGTRYGDCNACPHGRFDGGAPACSSGRTYYGVTEDLTGLYRVDFLKSHAKAGRNILKLALAPALWSRSFEIKCENHTGNSRNYYSMNAVPTGNRTDETTMQVCDALHDFFSAVYQQAVNRQTAYLERLKNGDNMGSATPVIDIEIDDDGSNVVDFSDSM